MLWYLPKGCGHPYYYMLFEIVNKDMGVHIADYDVKGNVMVSLPRISDPPCSPPCSPLVILPLKVYFYSKAQR